LTHKHALPIKPYLLSEMPPSIAAFESDSHFYA